MKNIITRFSCLLAVVVLAGCAAPQDAEHSQQPAAPSTAQGSSSMGTSASGDQPVTDLQTMCAMNQRLKSASPDERKIMLDEHLKGMSPEAQIRHMDMMAAQCK